MAILKVINGDCTDGKIYQNLVNYIFKEENKYRNYYGCQYIYNNGNDGIAMQLQAIAQYYHQTEGVLLYHYVVSFSPTYEGWIDSPAIALSIVGQAMAELPYAAIWCVHGDTDNLHVHIIMSSVDFTTGLKYENKKENQKSLAERIALAEFMERKKLGKIYTNTYDIIGEKQEEAYTTVSDCLVVYE